MGNKLEGFLRILGSGLSKSAFQANIQDFQQEKDIEAREQTELRAEDRATKELNVKQAFANLGVLGVALRKEMSKGEAADTRAIHKYGTAASEIADRFPKYSQGMKETFAAYGMSEAKEKAGTPTEIQRLQKESDRLRGLPQTPRVKEKIDQIEARIGKQTTVTGSTAQDLTRFTKKTESSIQDQLLKSGLAKDRLKVIKAGFKPEFTEVSTRASAKFTAAIEKMGFEPSKAGKKELAEFTTFSRNSLANLNQHIRDRTGAVMNINETGRLKGEMPNIGEGIFDSDSATQFKSKLDGALKTLEAAEDRLLFANANGLGVDPEKFSQDLPLSDFVDLPVKPREFDSAAWNRMSPSDRKELISLMNRKR